MNVLREPLLHFFALGALLFVAYEFLDRPGAGEEDTLVVSAGQIEHLARSFTQTWQRPPSESELQGLVEAYVREELFAREAVRLGLDRDDGIIRRRLEQKMQFIAEEQGTSGEPTDADLAAYLAGHPDVFREESRLSFRQVFLSPEKRGARLRADAGRLLAELRAAGAGAAIDARGDATLLPAELPDAPLSRVGWMFGEDFAASLAELPTGVWSGPVESGYGLHLVLVTGRAEGRLPALDEVREALVREWTSAQRRESSRRFLDELRSRYEIVVEWPDKRTAQAR